MDQDNLTPSEVVHACDLLMPLAVGWVEDPRTEWAKDACHWLQLMREMAAQHLQ